MRTVGQSFGFNTPPRYLSKPSSLNPVVWLAKMAPFGRLACGYGLNEMVTFAGFPAVIF